MHIHVQYSCTSLATVLTTSTSIGDCNILALADLGLCLLLDSVGGVRMVIVLAASILAFLINWFDFSSQELRIDVVCALRMNFVPVCMSYMMMFRFVCSMSGVILMSVSCIGVCAYE